MDKGLKDILYMVAIIILIVIRVFMKNNDWMDVLAIAALGIALLDLYSEVAERYGSYEKFVRVRGVALIVGIFYLICLCVVALKPVEIPARWVDVLSLSALLVSVPSSLYCGWVGKYISSCGKQRELRPPSVGKGHKYTKVK